MGAGMEMDFGKILDAWEKDQKTGGKRTGGKQIDGKQPGVAPNFGEPGWAREAEKYWNSYDKGEKFEGSSPEDRKERRERLRAMTPEAELDLHGMTVEEALPAMQDFFNDVHRRGLRKVLIIHGKGNHSKNAPVLKREVSLFLERCPYTGETGTPQKKWGGSGATWVLLKTGKEGRGYRSR